MKVFILRRVMMFGDGSSNAMPISVYEHEDDAKKAVDARNAGTVGVFGWHIVSPSGDNAGPLGAMLAAMGIARVGYDVAVTEVHGSALLMPDKRIIVPGN
jgi:hypothetical protein